MTRGAGRGDKTPVAIVGGGPVGLATALGLARMGVRSVLVERKDATSRTSKAPGIHVRTREILRQWGVEERFLEEGRLAETVTMHSVVPGRRPLVHLDFSELSEEADRPGLLILEQSETERLLLEAALESGLCEVRFGCEAVAAEQNAAGVRLTVREGSMTKTLEADYLVGCDGATSFVRGALGLPFEGITYSLRPVLMDVALKDERDDLPNPRAWTGAGGYSFAVRLRPGLWRIVHLPRGEPRDEEVTDAEAAEVVERLLGPGAVDVRWSSRFRIHVRSSPRFRVGRMLLAGDAAHVHSPASGFGMNGGVQDAHNLAWKLAYALQGGDVDRLLDSYETERRAVVVETTSRYTDWITRVFVQMPTLVRDTAWAALRAAVRIPAVRRMTLRRTAMIDLNYPPSPLLRSDERAAGVRLPNPTLRVPDGTTRRLYELLPYRAVILDVSTKRDPPHDLPLEDVIRVGPGEYEDPTGRLADLLEGEDGWILVRPDLHVARAGRGREGMDEAVRCALGTAPER